MNTSATAPKDKTETAPTSPDEPNVADAYQAARSIIRDLNRISPDGIEESFEVTLGGARQAVTLRGSDRANPLLLVLHGGPGVSAVPTAWTYQRPWEDFFTIVHWDQRGAGRSYALENPEKIAPTLVLQRYRDDAIELMNLLCQRFGQSKLLVMGQSWGTAVGLEVCKECPDLVRAYVGMSQIIDFRAAEAGGLQAVLSRARELRNEEAVRELSSLGAYPGTGPFDVMSAHLLRKWSARFGMMAHNRDSLDFLFASQSLSPLYSATDLEASQQGMALAAKTIVNQLIDLSFTSITRLAVPVVMLQGRHDAICPLSLVERWLDALDAPSKHLVTFNASAHLPHIEQPGRFLMALVNHVLPLAQTNTTPGEAPDRRKLSACDFN